MYFGELQRFVLKSDKKMVIEKISFYENVT